MNDQASGIIYLAIGGNKIVSFNDQAPVGPQIVFGNKYFVKRDQSAGDF
jgi:hypothetical protein